MIVCVIIVVVICYLFILFGGCYYFDVSVYLILKDHTKFQFILNNDLYAPVTAFNSANEGIAGNI